MTKDYMIRCDMEGVTGVVSYEQADPAGPEYELARQWFMAELIALVEGLQEGGAGRIVVYDEHYYGRNIDLAALPTGATAICGKPPYRADWAGGLDGSFAGVILHGLHAMHGTPGALLPHTYEHDIGQLVLNDTTVGEIGMEAAVAGDFGVPVVMLTGDSAGAIEAETLLPGIRTVSVKRSLGPSGGECLPLAETTRMIRVTAAAVAAEPPPVEPYRTGDHAELLVRLHEGPFLAAVQSLYPELFIAPDTLGLSGGSATAVWADYWQIKLHGQQIGVQE
ncbi:MAG: M55 family metallopeptidase [Planctomycetes bacterium]|nr:M55 family metallopeptidase [Planctomycetota bacterium]